VDVSILRILLASGMITLQALVGMVAEDAGVDPHLAQETVRLESEWDPEAVGDNGLAVGLWQFHGEESSDTWGWLCRITGHPEWSDDENRSDPVLSTVVAVEAIALGYGDHWTGWRIATGKEEKE